MDPLTGRLIVATHELTDRNFARSVVLVLAHDPDDGAAGVVLNHPTAAELPERLDGWTSLAAPPAVMFRGGPVSRDSVIGLGELASDTAPPGWQRVVGTIGVVDLSVEEGDLRTALGWVRLFSGYAGWGGGQLEDEIGAGAWFVVDAEPGDAGTAAPDGLWRVVLARQGGLFTTVPDDPALN
jgi:putative transcriptional regulator